MDVMIDLETLGTTPGSVILSIGLVAFDETGLHNEFYTAVNLRSCLDAGLVIDPRTEAWWMEQSPEARRVLDESRETETMLNAALDRADAFILRAGGRVWGNGSDFDMPILAAAYRNCGFGAVPWKYSDVRCYRTLKNLRPDILFQETGVHHNALDDAKGQAKHAVSLLKALTLSSPILGYIYHPEVVAAEC